MRVIEHSMAKDFVVCHCMLAYIEVDSKTGENVEEVRYFETHLTREACLEPITSVFIMHNMQVLHGVGSTYICIMSSILNRPNLFSHSSHDSNLLAIWAMNMFICSTLHTTGILADSFKLTNCHRSLT